MYMRIYDIFMIYINHIPIFLIINTRICQKYGAVHHQLRFNLCFLVGFSHASQAHDCNGQSIRDAITALDDPMEAGPLKKLTKRT